MDKALDDCKRDELKSIYRHGNEYPSLANFPAPNWKLYEGKRYLLCISLKRPVDVHTTANFAL